MCLYGVLQFIKCKPCSVICIPVIPMSQIGKLRLRKVKGPVVRVASGTGLLPLSPRTAWLLPLQCRGKLFFCPKVFPQVAPLLVILSIFSLFSICFWATPEACISSDARDGILTPRPAGTSLSTVFKLSPTVHCCCLVAGGGRCPVHCGMFSRIPVPTH